jgi:hypothetical protein
MIEKQFNKDRVALVYISMLTIIAVVYGFTIIPSPFKAREIAYDHKRVVDLGQIQSAIDTYYQNNNKLPNSLNDLPKTSDSITLEKADPQTQQPYEYHITNPTSYKLCANFTTDTTNEDSNYYDTNNPDYSTYSSDFTHAIGHKCFDENENGDSSNQYTGPTTATMDFTQDDTCQWTPTFSLNGFSPYETITVTSQGTLSDNCDASKTHAYSWSAPWNSQTDANGSVTIDYLQNDYGDYTYTFTDEDGNTASVHFSYGPNATVPTIYPSVTPVPTRFPCKAGEMCPMIPANQPSPGIYNGNLSTTPTPGHGGGGGSDG